MDNKALSETLVIIIEASGYMNRPNIFRYVDNNTYCPCFVSSNSHYNYKQYRGDGIDYHKVNNSVLCPKHMEIYMRKITENRIEKIEKNIDKMSKILESVLTALKHITYRVDRNNFEPEMNNLLGDITSEARPSEARPSEARPSEASGDKKEQETDFI